MGTIALCCAICALILYWAELILFSTDRASQLSQNPLWSFVGGLGTEALTKTQLTMHGHVGIPRTRRDMIGALLAGLNATTFIAISL